MTSGPRTPGADGATPGLSGAGRGGQDQEGATPLGAVDLAAASQTGAEVVLVHRPATTTGRYQRAKRRRWRASEETARREVGEETGLSCRTLGGSCPATTYVDGLGRAKTVRYWAMTVAPEGVVPSGRLAGPCGPGARWTTLLGPLDRARRA